MSSEFIKAGTFVTCPDCGVFLFEIVEDVINKQPIHAEKLRTVHRRISAQNTGCPECQGMFYYAGSIHTELGWFPHPPRHKR